MDTQDLLTCVGSESYPAQQLSLKELRLAIKEMCQRSVGVVGGNPPRDSKHQPGRHEAAVLNTSYSNYDSIYCTYFQGKTKLTKQTDILIIKTFF